MIQSLSSGGGHCVCFNAGDYLCLSAAVSRGRELAIFSGVDAGVGHHRGGGGGGFYRCLEVAAVVRHVFGLDWADSAGCAGAFYAVGVSFWAEFAKTA